MEIKVCKGLKETKVFKVQLELLVLLVLLVLLDKQELLEKLAPLDKQELLEKLAPLDIFQEQSHNLSYQTPIAHMIWDLLATDSIVVTFAALLFTLDLHI